MTNRFEIIVGGQQVADIYHTGIFGQHYEIQSDRGTIDASGDFVGWNYSLSQGGGVMATVARELALREKFTVDIAPGQDEVFVLAAVLAIDNIHDERREEQHGLGGGILGGGILGSPGRW
jgi:uncharacterized protein YxjI